MNYFIEKTLQLKDLNITICTEKVDEVIIKGQLSLVYYGKLSYSPKACECCGILNSQFQVVKNGYRQASRITLNTISAMPAYLKLQKQRYYCKECGQSFTAKSPIVAEHCFISNAVKRKIMDLATRVQPETLMAQDTHVSTHTVRRVIRQAAALIRVRPTQQLPEHISLDEFKSVRSVDATMSFIWSDALSHKVIDVVEDRKKRSLSAYFSRYPLEIRRQVKTATIDMYEPYMDLIQRWFPNAEIIIDPFHIIQAVNRELNRYRVQYMNSVRHSDRRLYNKLKRYWKLILKNPADLQATSYDRFRLFDWLTNTQGIVNYLLDHDECLRDTYRVVHQLGQAYRLRNWTLFESTLIQANQLNISSGLKRVLRTFKKYQKYIYNSFIYNGLTNGPLEGINNKIKVLKRNAYGYRNYSHFRDRILLMTRLYEPKPKKKDQTTVLVA